MTSMYDDSHLCTITDLRSYLSNPVVVTITLMGNSEERASWIQERLIRFKYSRLGKKDKSVVLKYLLRITGLGEKQLDRHIGAYKHGKTLCRAYKRRSEFQRQYSLTDAHLLAEVDNATERIAGGTTLAFMQAQHATGDIRFERLKSISVAGLYRLRNTQSYREKSLHISGTKSVNIPIGKRMKPNPKGLPGFIRVDTVHQGDLNGEKGVYHVNLVDEVTQWEVVFAVEEISEKFLLPLLEGAIVFFPFEIQNFHSDNGSEFINYKVASLLDKLRITQTKSRPRKSTDNGLVECKNGAIIRKEFGHWHIPGAFAPQLNKFYIEHLIPYLNYYRPCHFPEKEILPNGKIKILYPTKNCMTPYQKLQSLPDWESYLRKPYTRELLERNFKAKTPLESAKEKKKARDKLMKVVLPKLSNILPITIADEGSE